MINELKEKYLIIKPYIEARLSDFRAIYDRNCGETFLIELVFCLLTPQSSAKRSWEAVSAILAKNLLYTGTFEELRDEIRGVRFMNNKARYIIRLREQFADTSVLINIVRSDIPIIEKRKKLSAEVRGIGLKEGSHYLRNIGLGDDIAILDRHILKNMKALEIIDDIPQSLTERIYLDFEKRLLDFSEKIKIPASHLDFLLWHKETGVIFK